MAINSFHVPRDEIRLKSQSSSSYFKHNNWQTNKLVKTDFAKDESINSINKNRKLKKKFANKSPYINGDNAQLVSLVTEKRFLNKKGAKTVSSFPLATKLYKANSDEFKLLKKKKKIQKSVLTLPNKPSPMPQLTTASEFNDSEYYNQDHDFPKKIKKRIQNQNKGRVRTKGYEYYDRDALYCSQMDINLDCSSSDIIKNYNGDKKRKSKQIVEMDSQVEEKAKPHDVWAILRNINRFQFRQSPQISEDSFITPKKIKSPKRRNRKDMRVFETRTEEFAYISSIEVDDNSCTFSQSSSFDKITVIDKQAEFDKFCDGFQYENSNKNEVEKELSPRSYPKNVRKNKKRSVKRNIIPLTNEGNISCQDSGFTNGENKPFLANNGIAVKDYKNKNINKVEDTRSIKITNTSQASQCSEIIYSGNSGSSKADLNWNSIKNQKGKVKMERIHLNVLEREINGITKVVFNKGHNPVAPNKLKLVGNSRHQTTTVPNRSVIIPKLTQTAITRRLNKLKYPIIILDKDQLSSSFEVVNQKHLQFDGLNEKIWPFMLKWYGTDHTDRTVKTQRKCVLSNEQKMKTKHEIISKNALSNNTKYNNDPRQSTLKDNMFLNDVKPNKCKLDFNKKAPVLANTVKQTETLRKHKLIHQFRDRMVKLLYKNSSILSVIDASPSTNIASKQDKNTVTIDDCMQTPVKTNENNMKRVGAGSIKPSFENTPSPVEKCTWAKARWASDFIDNIIRKIRTGAYYTHDKAPSKKCDYREVEIQTVNRSASACDIHADESVHAIDIPGFDTVLPAVEIKTMNRNEISVKHCMTNILVHFDVTFPKEPVTCVKNSCSLIPIDVTKSHTKIFKCKTSILNATLPAELCSIFPIMLRNILETGEQLALPLVPVDNTSSHLSTITEATRCESPVNVHSPLRDSIIHHVTMSQELLLLLKGSYINTDKIFPKIHIVGKMSLLLKFDRRLIEQLMPRLTKVCQFDYEENPIIPMTLRSQINIASPSIPSEKINLCRALVPYTASDRKIAVVPNIFNLSGFFGNISRFVNSNVSDMIKRIVGDNTITINVIMRNYFNSQDTVSLSVGSFVTDHPLNTLTSSLISNNKLSCFTNALNKSIRGKFVDYTISKNSTITYLQKNVSVNSKKLKTKGFWRLYKKCKSISNIAEEKTTPLSRITDLDDFFRALGSGKLLSSIFDGQSSKKIMTMIQEMKNWTTEINPRQALLVLLLTNKKDTSNLLRYRPLILQGIAVNRITKANELDMEIEVIEREHLNTCPQYEGISYLPASIENQDCLFEELCWIAKNTASDYQRPFDESSEKLLKSLLQKRKKLNPSYLRVMARYVGLGLLKTPSKK